MKIDFALNFKKTRKELKNLFLGATQKLNYLLNYWAEGLAKALAITNSKGQISFGVPFGGMNVDGKTMVYDANTGTIKVNFSSMANGTTLTGDPTTNTVGIDYASMVSSLPPSTAINFTGTTVTISTNTTLNGDIYANDFTVNSGVTLTTNGHGIICAGTFTNNGTIVTGYASNSSYTSSYGGSGGGAIYGGSAGYSTLNSGGASAVSQIANGKTGTTPTAPTLSNSTINTWFTNGFRNYHTGAEGGANGSNTGGSGAYGLYIQADTIVAGTIYSNGENGTNGSGGGGGGNIVLAYGSGGYTAGTYYTEGGNNSPSPISYYLYPITLSNNQSTATSSSFQQLLQFTSLPNYINPNFQNVIFTDSTYSVLHSWIENTITSSTSSFLNPSNIWLNLGSNTIPANSNITVYIAVAQSTSTNYLNNTTTGANPSYTSTYGEYDNGGNIFNVYYNFSGTSTPSGMTSSGATINNGIISLTDTGYVETSATFSYPLVFDFYVNTAVEYLEAGFIQTLTTSQGALILGNGSGTMENVIYTTSGSNYSNFPAILTGLFSIAIANSTSSTGSVNYGNSVTNSESTGLSYPLPIGVLAYEGTGVTISSFNVNYIRTRQYPPNGIMPSMSIGNVSTITPSSGIGGNGQALTYSYGATQPVTMESYSLPASTNAIPLLSVSYSSEYGKPILIEFDGTSTASFGNLYITNNANGGVLGYGYNIYPDFKIRGMLPASVTGDEYTFTLYANNTTTSQASLNLYVAYAEEVGLALSG